MDSIERYDRKQKKVLKINYPNIDKLYNKNKGGVDLFDMLMALYRLDHKSKKWYKRIFLWAVNLCILNGWLTYKRQCVLHKVPKKGILCLLDFSVAVSGQLMHVNHVISVAKKRGRPSFFLVF